ncbi:MAG: SAM-dependent chlorinase/fluorinase [candidate division Zixibacteria bacterium]|nr:SAM-dependent chlorinase/fluorinase [candidate division Zixibacteria bacterium]
MSKTSGIITLTTDFGNDDYFVGAVKGVILSINPDAKIIDITHSVEPGNVKQGAFMLYHCHHNFPKGTVHLCVIDPGVGSDRKPLVIENESYYFIAPDNGVVYPCIDKTDFKVYNITPEKTPVKSVSNTFHGRDIFAPAAAYISMGDISQYMGEEVESIIEYKIPKPERTPEGLIGVILNIDRFGNLVTNFSPDDIRSFKLPYITHGDFKLGLFYKSYSQADPGEIFLINGSAGYVEISTKDNRASDMLQINTGDVITILEHDNG